MVVEWALRSVGRGWRRGRYALFDKVSGARLFWVIGRVGGMRVNDNEFAF